MLDFLSKNTSAIIGVIGTLLGVILGYILNRISKCGQIKVFQNYVGIEYFEVTSLGGRVSVTQFSNNTVFVKVVINIDFYNSSETSRKTARNISFLLKTKDNIIKKRLCIEAEDYRELINVSLQPKEIINSRLSYTAHENFDEILEPEWHIEFYNENKKIKKIKLLRHN